MSIIASVCYIYMLKLNWNVGELNFRRCVYVQSREERPEKVQAGERLGELVRGDTFKRSLK